MRDSAREKIILLLENLEYDALADLVSRRRGAMRHLNRLLYDPGSLLCWRAAEGIGAVADRLAGEDPEAVRVILRNLLWTVNEESGGIGWGAPQAMAEIICRRPGMFREFAPILLSLAGEVMLRRGVIWAAGRMAQADPDLVREAVPELTAFLGDPDPVVRGYTLRLLGILGQSPDFARYRHLLEDPGLIPLYQGGQLRETSVSALAAAVLRRPGQSPAAAPNYV